MCVTVTPVDLKTFLKVIEDTRKREDKEEKGMEKREKEVKRTLLGTVQKSIATDN